LCGAADKIIAVVTVYCGSLITHSYTQIHLEGLLRTSDQIFADAAKYTTNTKELVHVDFCVSRSDSHLIFPNG